MIKLLHNNSCSKSRCALEYLHEHEIEFELVDILADPLSELEIITVLKKLDLKAEDLVRTNENLYKEKFANKNFNDEQWIKILAEYPELVQRPIIVKGDKAIIGRPIERVMDFIVDK